jgi:hypothetical protein
MTARFRIGDVFPADDAVARFVLTLAMFGNDLKRSVDMFGDPDDDDPEARGRRLMLVRYQAAMFFEIVVFVRNAVRQDDVRAFVDALPATAARSFERMTESNRLLNPWLKEHRDVTFHYAKTIEEALRAALDRCADTVSMIRTGDDVGLGLPFADEVATQFVADTPAQWKERAVELRHAALASADFALAAVRDYVKRQDAALFTFADE